MSALSLLPFLQPANPQSDGVRQFHIGKRVVEVRAAVLLPDMLFFAEEDGEGIEAGNVLMTLPDGNSLRSDGVFYGIRQAGYVGAHTEVRVDELREHRGTAARLMRKFWRLKRRDVGQIALVQRETLEFSRNIMDSAGRYPDMEEVEAHVVKMPDLDNGVGFSPYTSVPPAWAAITDMDASLDALQVMQFAALNVGEVLGMYVERIDNFLEGVARVAEQALVSSGFWNQRSKVFPGQFITMAEELERVKIRPYGPHLCANCAKDFRAAAELYEHGDLPGAADKLQTIVDAIALSHVFVDMEDLLHDVSMDLRKSNGVSADSRSMLRMRTTKLTHGFPRVQPIGEYKIVERAADAIVKAHAAALGESDDTLDRIRASFLEVTPGH